MLLRTPPVPRPVERCVQEFKGVAHPRLPHPPSPFVERQRHGFSLAGIEPPIYPLLDLEYPFGTIYPDWARWRGLKGRQRHEHSEAGGSGGCQG